MQHSAPKNQYSKNEKRKAANRRKQQTKHHQKSKNFVGPLPRKVLLPVASARAFQTQPPRVSQNTAKSCRIRHREFIDSILYDGTFTPRKFPINPGEDETFSWLSNIAVNWERYKFHRLSFHYLTRSSSTATGSVLMAVDFDAADKAPVDELTMMSYEGAREDSLWKDITIHCNVRSLSGGRTDHFCRPSSFDFYSGGPGGASLDIKTYDCGNLWVAVDRSGNGIVGKLFVDYDVEFFTPQLPASGDPNVSSARAINAGSVTKDHILGEVPNNALTANIGKFIYDAVTSKNVMTLLDDVPEGLLNLDVTGTGITDIPLPLIKDVLGIVKPNAFQLNQVINAGAGAASKTCSVWDLVRGDTFELPTITCTTGTAGQVNLTSAVVGTFPRA